MAGHSKWANIKHRKAKQDKRKGKIFTRLIREISISAKMGGGDASANPRLRAAVQAALAENMTKDTIEKAIKRGVGGEDAAAMEEIRYEGYGLGGVAVLVDCLTDNRTRTVSEVRHAFTKCGGNLGTDGSVSYLFDKKGVISFEPEVAKTHEDKILEIALSTGALDVINHLDGSIDVYTSPELFGVVLDGFEAGKLKPVYAEVSMMPENYIEVENDRAEKLSKMIDMLEELDDVQNVYTNANFPENLLQ